MLMKNFKLEIKIIFILIKIYFIVITIYLNDKTISNIKFIFFYFRTKFEVNNIDSYYNFCNENTKIIKDFKKSNNIKVSIISPIHNREKFLLTFLKSIQFQDFKNIEIILVDDKSILYPKINWFLKGIGTIGNSLNLRMAYFGI